ncbi:MAG: hypothetical protein QOG09_1738 [Solirubrobacterales bacterium]|nr:hypothetical protein [Solirubrobacterales bacterium]MDX6663636.1 hypothetical protein [Solirubrobacterales bacterium]
MPRVSRKRLIEAPVDEVWAIVSDPYHLPRWWPRTRRVENVRKVKGGRRSQWTTVYETQSGRAVRADYRVLSSATDDRYIFEQQLEGTPFEKVLRSSVTEIGLEPREDATEVRITNRQRLRGLSRLGSPMMGRAQRQIVDDALEGLQAALSGPAAVAGE